MVKNKQSKIQYNCGTCTCTVVLYVLPAESSLPETFGFSEMSAVARFGTSEISVQARFRVRTFFICAQVKNFFELECPVCMVVVQPQDLPNWHAKGLKKYLLPQQALFCGNAARS